MGNKPKHDSRNQSAAVYARLRTNTIEAGTTRGGGNVRVPANVRPLEEFVQPSQVTTHSHGTWKNGHYEEVAERTDIVRHAQKSISRLKMASPATGNLRLERQRAAAAEANRERGFGQPEGIGYAMPCGPDDWCAPGSPAPRVPLSGGTYKKRSY